MRVPSISIGQPRVVPPSEVADDRFRVVEDRDPPAQRAVAPLGVFRALQTLLHRPEPAGRLESEPHVVAEQGVAIDRGSVMDLGLERRVERGCRSGRTVDDLGFDPPRDEGLGFAPEADHHPLEPVGRHAAVVVRGRDEAGLHAFQTSIARGGGPALVRADVVDAQPPVAQSPYQPVHFGAAPLLGDDERGRPRRAVSDRLEAPVEERSAEGRHEDGDVTDHGRRSGHRISNILSLFRTRPEAEGSRIQPARGSVETVTVVIPTHDRVELLDCTLEAALDQHDVDLSIIVVDDGSRRDPRDVLPRLADPRVRVIRTTRATGVARARNRGIAAAEGDWVAFLDDDDLWSPDKLALQIGRACEKRRAWSYGGAVAFEGDRLVGGGAPPSPETAVAELPWRNVVPAGASNVVVRRETLDATGGFDPALRHMADWDLWVRLSRVGPPAVVDDPVVAYRIHPGNASRELATIPAEIDRMEERHRDLRSGRPIDRAHVYRWIGWNAMRDRDRRSAVRAYLRAVRQGDLSSLTRIPVALLWPGITGTVLDHHLGDPAWIARARTRLDPLVRR